MFSSYAKATVGAVLAGLTAAATALGDNSISGQEGVTIAIAVVTVFGGVFATTNKP